MLIQERLGLWPPLQIWTVCGSLSLSLFSIFSPSLYCLSLGQDLAKLVQFICDIQCDYYDRFVILFCCVCGCQSGSRHAGVCVGSVRRPQHSDGLSPHGQCGVQSVLSAGVPARIRSTGPPHRTYGGGE